MRDEANARETVRLEDDLSIRSMFANTFRPVSNRKLAEEQYFYIHLWSETETQSWSRLSI